MVNLRKLIHGSGFRVAGLLVNTLVGFLMMLLLAFAAGYFIVFEKNERHAIMTSVLGPRGWWAKEPLRLSANA